MSPTSLGRLSALSLACVAACGGDDDGGDGRARYTVTLENRATPRVALSARVVDTPAGAPSPRAIGPGEAFEATVVAPPGARLAVATMLIPSNDLFIAPEPQGLDLYLQPTNQPASGNLTAQLRLWDAGTEANQPLGEGNTQNDDVPMRGQAAANLGPRDPNANVRLAEGMNLPPVAEMVRLTVTPNQNMPGITTEFRVRIENVSTSATLRLAMGTRGVALSPAILLVQGPGQIAPLFRPGEPDRGLGLESLAEDGNPAALAASLAGELGPNPSLGPGAFAVFVGGAGRLFEPGASAPAELEALAEEGRPADLARRAGSAPGTETSGIFELPASASSPGPIGPGQRFTFVFEASPGARLAFATMLMPTNDVFLATPPEGLPIDAAGELQGLRLYDAGTEQNEAPGLGAGQPPLQERAGAGTPESQPVRPLAEVQDGFTYPAPEAVVRVTVARQGL